MRQSATRALHSYWSDLRGERAAPERADVDPAALRGVLPDTFMLEVDAARSFPVILAGSRCNAIFGSSLRARNFVDLFDPADRYQIAAVCSSVCDDAAPVVAGLKAAAANGPALDLEMLLLPLRHRGKTHSRIIGSFSPAGFPDWLGLVPVATLSLASMRMLLAPEAARRAGAAERLPSGRAGDAVAVRENASHRRAAFSVVQGGRAGSADSRMPTRITFV